MIKESLKKADYRCKLDLRGIKSSYERNNVWRKATDAQIGAFLTALRIKGETSTEITGFTAIMKQCCNQIHPKVTGRLVDTCGTGGDKVKTFNISTTAAFIVAGASISVAKHGNRSVTSKCGSADVLERLGLNLNMEPKRLKGQLKKWE